MSQKKSSADSLIDLMEVKVKRAKRWGKLFAVWGSIGVSLVGTLAILVLFPGIGWLAVLLFLCNLAANGYIFWGDNKKAFSTLTKGTSETLKEVILERELRKSILGKFPKEERARVERLLRKIAKNKSLRDRLWKKIIDADSELKSKIEREIAVKEKLHAVVEIFGLANGLAFGAMVFTSSLPFLPHLFVFLHLSFLLTMPWLVPVIASVLAVGVAVATGMQFFTLLNSIINIASREAINEKLHALFYPPDGRKWGELKALEKVKLVVKDAVVALSLPAVVFVAFLVNLSTGGAFRDAIFKAVMWFFIKGLPSSIPLVINILSGIFIVPVSFLFTLEHGVETAQKVWTFIFYPRQTIENFLKTLHEHSADQPSLSGGRKWLCYSLTFVFGIFFLIAAAVHCAFEGAVDGRGVKNPDAGNTFIKIYLSLVKWFSSKPAITAFILTALAHVLETLDFSFSTTDKVANTVGDSLKESKMEKVPNQNQIKTEVFSRPTSISDRLLSKFEPISKSDTTNVNNLIKAAIDEHLSSCAAN